MVLNIIGHACLAELRPRGARLLLQVEGTLIRGRVADGAVNLRLVLILNALNGWSVSIHRRMVIDAGQLADCATARVLQVEHLS